MASCILTMHQLDDFVPGGKFAEEASNELWQSIPQTMNNNSKSIQEHNHLLSKAREQGISLRKKHGEQEKETEHLEATHRQKMERSHSRGP